MVSRSTIFRFPACILLLVLLVLPGCAPDEQVMLNNGDNGSVVTINSDQELILRLDSNPTTGYSWGILTYDPAVLEPQGEPEYISEAGAEQRPGSGGWEVFHFRPVAAGQTELTLIYRRPWETDVEPVERYSVDVTVR